ncbi:type II secretion system protein [Alteromonas lipolytica]|uniref:Prepilin-type N-terminal cleavage/methylation domain-containing protein n=1 Tax=Alteromonas lipolytica TaxID=1856405 RepID=A0A1E8F8H6_9ALTE|nr:type II secretion system protein [Alteromonas lipolytica]OFI32221.1 hypothetical protein BFC17_08360 [Alteromonas lipolytica]GGF82896.1 hypothetical protein GCM10011338_38960 [Alteromonas lipolytica]
MRPDRLTGRGFTLVELITVIVLIGILAVVAGTRLQTRQGYSEYAYQDRLVSALRNMQTRAMQDTRSGFCFRLNFVYGANSTYGPPSLNYSPGNGAATCAAGIAANAPAYLSTLSTELSDESITLSSSDGANLNFSFMGFDALGRPYNDLDNSPDCDTGSPCRITFTGETSVAVCVEEEGYIHAC